MEKCHYCGISYHPMMVWVRGAGTWESSRETIHVCNRNLRRMLGIKNDPDQADCEMRAASEGYTAAPKLTPRR
jgi:NMD protein affecting ribosome stability and mRNA decay